MLRIDHLSKRYGNHVLFQALTVTFPPGCIALCEEESTGKSSLLGIIAGVIRPDAGDVWIDGYSLTNAPQQAKTRLAYVPDDCFAFPAQTGRGLLNSVASEKSTTLDEATLELAYRLGLEPHLDKRFDQMSTGTRRKVFLAAAALGDPALIVADGPTNGLDAPARAVLAAQFNTWSQDRVVLFASHDTELIGACQARTVNVADLR